MTENKYVFYLLLILLISVQVVNAQHDWTRTNPGGGGATSMILSTASGDLIAGSDLSGVYKSVDDGLSWTVLGAVQGLNRTHITALAVDYTDGNTFFAGTGDGIFKTSDGGTSFTHAGIQVTGGLGYVESIEMSPSNAMVGYAAHHEWWGVNLSFLRTANGGDLWNIVSTSGIPSNATITKMIVDQNDENIVYALTGKSRYRCSEARLYKSINGGTNWTQIAVNEGDILDFDLHPTDNSIVFVSTFEANNCSFALWQYVGGNESSGAFYKSTDGGTSFVEIGSATGFISVGLNPDEISITNFLFPVDWGLSPAGYNSQMGTWKTTNGGTNWTKDGDLPNWIQGWPVLNYAYTRSFYGLAKSISKDRLNPSKKYGAFGGYAWISNDAGSNFTNVSTTEVSPDKFLSNGLDNINGNSLDVSDANPNTIYAGYYDLGFWVSRDHGISWKFSIPDHTVYPSYVWGGGGGSNCNFVLNDPARENVVWSTFGPVNTATKGAVFKSTAYGENWQISNNGLAALGGMTHGMSIDLNSTVTNRTLFVTQEGDVFKSTDDGANWTRVLTNGGLKFTEVDKFNPLLVYAGGENGLWRSIDGGITWSEVGLPEMRYEQQIAGSDMRPDIVPTFDNAYSIPPIDVWNGVFEVKADPNVADRVYVVAFGSGKGLYRSDDAGVTWSKLYDNDYLRGIAISPNNSDVIYIGSTLAYHSGSYKADALGILYSEDGGGSWTTANDQMSWTFGGRMEIETGATPEIWVWSPGTGVQHSVVVDSALPIELTSFEGRTLKAGSNQLEWSTNMEQGFDRFEIERSRDGRTFTTLDIIQSSGNFSSSNSYTFLDKDIVEKGNHYYRLKMFDNDETYSYSNIIILRNDRGIQVSLLDVHPNPTSQFATFSYAIQGNHTGHFSIIKTSGENVRTFEEKLVEGENEINVDVRDIDAGTYYLVLKTQLTQVSTMFVVVK